MANATILWADDEIDLLRPHIMYLEEKGYRVVAVTSGRDALDAIGEEMPDMVFLDEQMPGLSGIDTLKAIKQRWPQLPAVMITKSEEEHIMDDALGGKISDYLIKPVSPSQLLLTVKKHTERRRLQSEHSTLSYQQQFREIGMELADCRSTADWETMYRRLVFWDLELAATDDTNIHDIFLAQRHEAGAQFCRFYESHYLDWLAGREEKPLMSHTVLKERLMPLLKTGNPPSSTFLIVIDNFRYDQWKYVQPLVEPLLRVDRDELCWTILPTTTQFARNAMFAGLMPSEIERKYPQWWVNEDEEGYKNQYEDRLLEENLRRHGLNVKMSYNKVLNAQYGRRLVDRVDELMHNDLNVVIYNFVDMLSHASTDSNVVRELADSDRAYRSLTRSWMEHSPLMEMLRALAERNVQVVLTTDHGSSRVERPVRVKGDREVSVNLRYKQGRLLDYNPKEVFEVKDPALLFLPRRHVTSPYIFARAGDFFAYPNNYNRYVQLYTGTFQHGGVSMEETLVPWVTLTPRK
ncbi:MAG: PglZ domain-containing protein [Bacteroidales bacterium]|nr:PglZ domain-containing protein [Bacteroidales bacterium]